MEMKACEAMVKSLEIEGIRVVFGYPGAAICPFYDELSRSSVRHILVRHEQCAGHAANGYARISGKPAVCIATSGPGALNLLTAIATAYADSIPVVIITGQVNLSEIGRDVFQEADITGAAEPFVKHSYLVKHAEDIPHIFKEAFYIAGSGRPGPVLIDVPMDVQNEIIDFDYPDHIEIRSYRPSSKGNVMQVKRAAAALMEAERPLICAGGGIFAAGGKAQLKELQDKTGIPMVTTMMGISVTPSDNPLYYGMIGMHGVKAANIAMRECDVLLLVGARVGDRAVSSPSFLSDTTKIIHIDIDPAEIGKNAAAHIPIVGSAELIMAQLTEKLEGYSTDLSGWVRRLDEVRGELHLEHYGSRINPKRFMHDLSEKCPDNTVCVADVGQNQIWTSDYFRIKHGRFLTSGGMGTMGYSLPAAEGAKMADPEAEVIAICGDGSFQMQFMELATMVQHGIAVKIVVMNNSRLGMVREVQTNKYGGNLMAVILDGNPDFTALAKAYGIPSEKISNPLEINGAVERMLAAKTPYLIECLVDPFEKTL